MKFIAVTIALNVFPQGMVFKNWSELEKRFKQRYYKASEIIMIDQENTLGYKSGDFCGPSGVCRTDTCQVQVKNGEGSIMATVRGSCDSFMEKVNAALK